MILRLTLVLSLAVCATALLAHEGVKNPAVMARMHGMKEIGAATSVLGRMAKGQMAFEASAAQDAARAIARHSAESIALFEPLETDPKSEARPAIWEDFADFTDKARALETLAEDLAGTLFVREDVQGAMRSLGAACSACHKAYRD